MLLRFLLGPMHGSHTNLYEKRVCNFKTGFHEYYLQFKNYFSTIRFQFSRISGIQTKFVQIFFFFFSLKYKLYFLFFLYKILCVCACLYLWVDKQFVFVVKSISLFLVCVFVSQNIYIYIYINQFIKPFEIYSNLFKYYIILISIIMFCKFNLFIFILLIIKIIITPTWFDLD